MCSDEISSNMPPPTWNEAMEMPKKLMMCRPASPLMAITQKAENALTRRVRKRSSRLRPWVKARKNGTAPTGLTMASRAISGLNKSIDVAGMGIPVKPAWAAGRASVSTVLMLTPSNTALASP